MSEEMTYYLKEHGVPYLIDDMIIAMDRDRPANVLDYMTRWISDKKAQKEAEDAKPVLNVRNAPQLSDSEKAQLSGFAAGGAVLKRTGTIMDQVKSGADHAKGIADSKSELEHAYNLDISATETSMQGIKRLNGVVCTIGPISGTVEVLKKLMSKGMNIARLNFSHGSYDSHTVTVENVRQAAKETGRLVGLALDTKGPEIRTGKLKCGSREIMIEQGTKIKVTTKKEDYTEGTTSQIYIDYKNFPAVVELGGKIYIDDGLLQLKVESIHDDHVMASAINTAPIGDHKGVNLPDAKVDLPAISEKDKADLAFARKMGMDMVFASFVRRASDIEDVRAALGPGDKVMIIAKIENQEGCDNVLDILKAADGIMVARGDLGIEIAPEKVFIAQKKMIGVCNALGKPVICATQMLESMVKNPRPTRAEVTDVCNAVYEGADCTMLSGETAKGKYPCEAVETMAKCALQAQGAFSNRSKFEQIRAMQKLPLPARDVIAQSAVNTAYEIAAAGIVVLSNSGTSARMISKYRPHCPIFAVTSKPTNARQLLLSRACYPVLTEEPKDRLDYDSRIQAGINYGKVCGDLCPGDQVVVVHSDGNRPELGANLVRVVVV